MGIKILGSSMEYIRCLLNVDNVKLEDLEAIKELVVSYYKKLLGQLPSQLYNSGIARVTYFFLPIQFSCKQKELLQGGATAYEIKDTIFSMKDEWMTKRLVYMGFLHFSIKDPGPLLRRKSLCMKWDNLINIKNS